MSRKLARPYPGPLGMLAVSLACHLAVFFIIATWYTPELGPDQEAVTYVDMVTLPVASPQSGMPAPASEGQSQSAAPAPPPAAPPAPAPVMTQPAKPSAKAPAKVEQPSAAAEAQAFNERMARLERIAQDKRQAEVLEKLKKKGTSTQTGMPTGKGTEAGSDYHSYLQSRLKDAFRGVIVSQTKAPVVIATITVSPEGRITEYRVKEGSGDPLFDDAVSRAVKLAGKSLVPPPGGAQFREEFRFKPEEVK